MARTPEIILSPAQQRRVLRLILRQKRRQLLAIEQELNSRRFRTDDDETEGAVLEQINECFVERRGLSAQISALGGTGGIPFPTDDEIEQLSEAVERLDRVTLSTASTREVISAAHALVGTFPS